MHEAPRSASPWSRVLRKRIGAQVNKGETFNGLHKFLLFANEERFASVDLLAGTEQRTFNHEFAV